MSIYIDIFPIQPFHVTPMVRDYLQTQILPHQMPNLTMENGGHMKVMLNLKPQNFSLLIVKCLLDRLMTFLRSGQHCLLHIMMNPLSRTTVIYNP